MMTNRRLDQVELEQIEAWIRKHGQPPRTLTPKQLGIEIEPEPQRGRNRHWGFCGGRPRRAAKLGLPERA